MNVLLECDVVLSKKLEAICDNGEPISIHITSVFGNKGKAIVRMCCKDGTSEQDIAKIGETSVMLKVNAVTDDIKSIGNAARVTNLIGGEIPKAAESIVAKTSPHIPEGEPYNGPLNKPAAGKIDSLQTMKLIFAAMAAAGLPVSPEMMSIVAPAVVDGAPPKEAEATVAPVATKPSAPQAPRDNCIMTYEELMKELDTIPNVNAQLDIPTNRKLTPREAGLILSQLPRLRRKAYLRNNLQSQFMISDLFTTIDGGGNCLSIMPGSAYDLTTIPARNILNSTELARCFETGKVSLVNAATYVALLKKMEAAIHAWDNAGGLKVYGGDVARMNPHDSAGSAAESIAAGEVETDDNGVILTDSQHSNSSSIVVDAAPNDTPPSMVYEESPIMQHLLSSMPTHKG